MPEYPDIALYLGALQTRIVGHRLEAARVASPFLVRTVDPRPEDLAGRVVTGVDRIGKRLVWAFDGDWFAVLHLMIAGRLRWRERGAVIPARVGLAAFDFPDGSVLLTEAGSRKRASLHVLRGREALDAIDPGGLDPLRTDRTSFSARLRSENHTLKRALTDARILSGIGNAYSDEILHAAGLSPLQLTSRLEEAEIGRLYDATRRVLSMWTERLRVEAGNDFPERVTAFREGMAVHGRFGQPCPRCGSPVQRITYAHNQGNYCPTCQTGGRLLADRSMSRLLRQDWPHTLEELEAMKLR
jgi:formamidopyrimidine-DNA glycosylase